MADFTIIAVVAELKTFKILRTESAFMQSLFLRGFWALTPPNMVQFYWNLKNFHENFVNFHENGTYQKFAFGTTLNPHYPPKGDRNRKKQMVFKEKFKQWAIQIY